MNSMILTTVTLMLDDNGAMAMGGGCFDGAWVTNVDVWHGTLDARNLE